MSEESDAGLAGAQTVAAANLVRLFGERSFSVILVSLGTVFAAFSMALRVGDSGWELSEFIAGLAFGALLVILGCVERMYVYARRVDSQSPTPQL